jgi:hypothetical protein
MCGANETLEMRPLPFVDRVVLWTMRAWVIGITRKLPVDDQIQEAFTRLGAPDAAGQLCGFMWVLGHGACRTLAIDCVCKPGTSADERHLLDILALTQHGRTFEAMLLLRAMMRPGAANAGRDAALRVTASLTAAGHIMTPGSTGTTRHVLASDHPVTDATPAFRTIH